MEVLNINLNDKEEAKKQIKIIQDQIDELILVIESQKQQLSDNLNSLENTGVLVNSQQERIVDLVQALKHVHIVLSSKKDLFQKDGDLESLMTTLAHFVTSSSAIKIGVSEEAKNESNK